jgi:hypothetical protein
LISRSARFPGRFVGFRAKPLITASVAHRCSPLEVKIADSVRSLRDGQQLGAPDRRSSGVPDAVIGGSARFRVVFARFRAEALIMSA